ncbi:MAG: hypothetical protein P8I94_06955, partial [Emcibacteraceae bacterium]|nr:hypothetical protein [Emcibacteraceae bacterium]
VERDYKIAEEYFLKAADGGVSEAQKFVGEAHAMGNPIDTNNIYVNMWFTIASKSGDLEANRYKQALEKSMSPQEITAAETAAEKWISENTE